MLMGYKSPELQVKMLIILLKCKSKNKLKVIISQQNGPCQGVIFYY